MFSVLRPSLLYTDISLDIAEHDEDHDASEWAYSDKMVFRGSLDGSYKTQGLDVYWLYDDNLNRIGLAEHETNDHSIFETLWFKDTPFGTLLQEDWTADGSLFSKMTPEAYQDSTEMNILLKARNRLVTPDYVANGLPDVYECSCGASFSPTACASVKKKVSITEPIFVDESFIMYRPPPNSAVWSRLGLPQCGASDQEQEQTQVESPGPVPPQQECPA